MFAPHGLLLFYSVAQGLLQLNVTVEKDEVGYGLTVSGDKPVYVQQVKESKFYLRPPMICNHIYTLYTWTYA